MENTIIQQSPKLIPVLTDPNGLRVQIVLAFVTFFTLIVALFQERIKNFFNQSKLGLNIILEPPDCHQIDLTDQSNGNFISKCIYIRIRVTNISKKTAKNIEIMASNLWKSEGDKEVKVKTFLPMNLRWSHLHPTTETIPPQSFRFCDLGPFRPIENETILKVDTIVQPNPVSGGIYPNILKSGKYILELLISGDNIEPNITKWNISFLKEWSDDETTMLKNISITKI